MDVGPNKFLTAHLHIGIWFINKRNTKLENGLSRGEAHWSVFDGVKSISTSQEALMADINSAITCLKHARASAFLRSPVPVSKDKNIDKKSNSQYDARMADDAYKAGLASMAAGKLDDAVHALNNALSKCPPDQTSGCC